MTMRYWIMTAFTMGIVLLLPGAVFADGHGHPHSQESHQPENQYSQARHTENHGKSGSSHGNQVEKKDRSHSNHGQDPSKKQASPGKQHSQGAEHANQQAQQHAAAQSAVDEKTASQGTTDRSKNHKATHQKEHKKTERKHNHSVQHATHQVQKTSEAKAPVKPSVVAGKRKQSPKRHQTVSKLPKKPRPEKVRKPKQHPKPKQYPVPDRAPKPTAVISFSPTAPEPEDHSQRQNEHSFTTALGIGIVPEWLHHNGFSVQSFVTRRAQYGNQWINAPPSPPPKNLLLFSA